MILINVVAPAACTRLASRANQIFFVTKKYKVAKKISAAMVLKTCPWNIWRPDAKITHTREYIHNPIKR